MIALESCCVIFWTAAKSSIFIGTQPRAALTLDSFIVIVIQFIYVLIYYHSYIINHPPTLYYSDNIVCDDTADLNKETQSLIL